jgi:hypothetical protein
MPGPEATHLHPIRKVAFALLLLGLLPALEAAAQTTKPSDSELGSQVAELLQLYGVNDTVEQIPALLQAQLENGQSDYPPEVYTILRDAFAEAYRAQTLNQNIARYVEAHTDPNHLSAARIFLRTPLARKLIAMETQAAAGDTQEAMGAFAEQFDASTPEGHQRLQLIQALDQATGTTEVALKMTLETAGAVVRGVQPLLPEDKRLTEKEITDQLQSLEAQMQMTLRYGTWLSLLYTYREASDDELREYLSFAESAEGRWLNRTVGDALIAALRTAGEEVGRRIGHAALQRHAALRFLTLPAAVAKDAAPTR